MPPACDQAAWVDLSQPEIGIPVVRVIVPGLEGPWTPENGEYAPGPRARAARGGCRMNAVVFLGPTLPRAEAADLLPATYLPPARQGDIYRAVRALRPVTVGLVDGRFLDTGAVWHREILWALSQGVHVFGAASMGALRAAELAPFGMRGVGQVFAAYRDGCWPGDPDAFEDDDEVAVRSRTARTWGRRAIRRHGGSARDAGLPPRPPASWLPPTATC